MITAPINIKLTYALSQSPNPIKILLSGEQGWTKRKALLLARKLGAVVAIAQNDTLPITSH